jgi:predicted DNA binding CopG/RHH family protein
MANRNPKKRVKMAEYDLEGQVHFRVPSDLLPRVHAHARSRGLTAASWMRMVIIEALERGGTVLNAHQANSRADV